MVEKMLATTITTTHLLRATTILSSTAMGERAPYPNVLVLNSPGSTMKTFVSLDPQGQKRVILNGLRFTHA
jgi:hypothetical protein